MVKTRVVSFALVSALVACGGGGGDGSPADAGISASQVSAISPAQLSTYSADAIQALGSNIIYLSNQALQALSYVEGANVTTGSGQVGAITAAQIALFKPAQVRMIGAAGMGGSVSNARLDQLSAAAWAQLVQDPSQVSALTPAEIKTLRRNDHIVAMGDNIKYLSDAALQALFYVDAANVPTGSGHVGAITVAQIATLSPAQVRMIGAAGMGGSVSNARLDQLNAAAWAQLVQNPSQVAALTPAEIKTLRRNDHIVAMGANIKYLSDAALQALVYVDAANVPTGSGHVGAITVAQIATLSPAQVRMIGAAGMGGSVSNARLDQLNAAAWAQLVQDPSQVAALTPAEIKTLRRNDHIIAMGDNIKYLSDVALQALTFVDAANVPTGSGQVGAITVAQIASLSPAQVRMIGAAGMGGAVANARLDQLNAAAWEQLVKDPNQVAAFTPAETQTFRRNDHFVAMGDNFRFLSDACLNVLTAGQKSLVTPAQKALLTTTQHAACGC